MRAGAVLAASGLTLAGCVSPTGSGKMPTGRVAETGSAVSAAEAAVIVGYHNEKRAEVGVGPVSWSPELARFAQERADTIARTGRFGHLPRSQNPYGENLAQGGTGGGYSGYTVRRACEDWYAEKALMPAGARVMTPALFRRGVGHYTQMVWKDTTRIGAGVATYEKGGFTLTVVVCCYDPPGNFMTGEIY